MWIAFYIYFVFTSLIVIPGIKEVFVDPKNASFTIGALIMYGIATFNSTNTRTFGNKWISLIFIYLILSFGANFFLPIILAIPGETIKWNIWNYLPTINVLAGILLIKTLYERSDTVERWVTLGKVISWTAFACSVFLIIQFLGLDQFMTEANGWYVKQKYWEAPIKNPFMTSLLGSPYFAGNFIALLSPICLAFKELRYKIFYVTAWTAVFISQSSVAFLTAFGSLLVYLVLMKNWKILTLSILLCANLFVVAYNYKPDVFSLTGRQHFWRAAIIESKKHFILGEGLGSFEQKGMMAGIRHVNHVHNDFIEIQNEGGIVLTILVFGYLFGIFKRIFYSEPDILLFVFTAGLVGFLINAQFSFPMRYAPFALAGLTYLAFLEARTGDTND